MSEPSWSGLETRNRPGHQRRGLDPELVAVRVAEVDYFSSTTQLLLLYLPKFRVIPRSTDLRRYVSSHAMSSSVHLKPVSFFPDPVHAGSSAVASICAASRRQHGVTSSDSGDGGADKLSHWGYRSSAVLYPRRISSHRCPAREEVIGSGSEPHLTATPRSDSACPTAPASSARRLACVEAWSPEGVAPRVC